MKVTKKIFEYYVDKFSNDLEISKKKAREMLSYNVEIFEKYNK